MGDLRQYAAKMALSRQRRRISLLFLLAIFGPLNPSHSTSFQNIAPGHLEAHADLILIVRIEAQEARWLRGGTKIARFHNGLILKTIKGAPTKGEATHVKIGLPGGTVADLAQWVAGSPMLKTGAEYLVFLGPPHGPSGARGVVGLARGALEYENGKLRPLVATQADALSEMSSWLGVKP